MNPKNVNDLDPKLKETYERVMGTTFPTPQPAGQPQSSQPAAPSPAQTVQTPQPQPVMQSAPASSNPMQTSQIFRAEDPFKADPPATPPADLIAKANMNSGVVAPQEPKKKHNFIVPLFLGLGGLVFFIAYAVIWAKYFNLF